MKLPKNVNWFKVVIFVIFVPVILGAVLVSAQHTYEVLVQITNTHWAFAAGAAAVIDLALILLGTMSAYYAKMRDDITQLNTATWFLIVLTVGVNFWFGFMNGGWIGGLVSMIYPLVGALIYHFIIHMTIQETKRKHKRVLPEKPIFSKALPKKRRKEIMSKWDNLTGDMAEFEIQGTRDRIMGTKQGDKGQLEERDMSPIKVDAVVGTGDTEGTPEINAKRTDVVPELMSPKAELDVPKKNPIGFVSPETNVPVVKAEGTGTKVGDKGTVDVPEWVQPMELEEFLRKCKEQGVGPTKAHQYLTTFNNSLTAGALKKRLQRM